jgi:hypothetical protein
MPVRFSALFGLAMLALSCEPAAAEDQVPAHGMWIWKVATVLEAPHALPALTSFCQSLGINEVYVSASGLGEAGAEKQLAGLIGVLHRSGIQVQALLSSEDADEPGKPREAFLQRVRKVIEFNDRHGDRFDGLHLDIEPQQRAENKGAGNLRFVPGLVDTYRAVRREADRARLTVDADIQIKLLKGSLAERRMLLSSLPRLTLMLYEVSGPRDGKSAAEKRQKLHGMSREALDMAYRGLTEPDLGTMAIALRTADYGDLLQAMLQALDEANGSNPHYRGWARHSYNDTLNTKGAIGRERR